MTQPEFHTALAHHQAGRLPQAEALYRQILQTQPQHADALHLLGVIALQVARHDAAIDLITRALQIAPSAAMHANLGTALQARGDVTAAQSHFRQAIALDPRIADTWSNLGNLLQEQGQLAEAVDSYRQALALQANFYQVYNNLGSALALQGNFDEAYANYQHALALKPDYADAHNNLGRWYKEQEKFDTAIACFCKAIEYKPNFADALNNLGTTQRATGAPAAAVDSLRQALQIKPDFVDALVNLSNALRDRDQVGDLEAAFECCQKALTLQAQSHRAWSGLAAAQHALGQCTAALESYQQALAIKPDFDEARFNMGIVLLSMGQMEAGWRNFRARCSPSLKPNGVLAPTLPFPEWQGEPLAGKSLLIWPEQGLGDEIQFCRYTSLLKRRGARHITLICKAPLYGLFQRLEGVDTLLTLEQSDTAPAHDYWCLLMNLPLYSAVSGAEAPPTRYVTAEPARVGQFAKLLAQAGVQKSERKIGVCWRGGPGYRGDAKRSPGLAPFRALFALPNIRWFTLLPDSRPEFLQAAGDAGFDLGYELGASFEETAALMSVITEYDAPICKFRDALNSKAKT